MNIEKRFFHLAGLVFLTFPAVALAGTSLPGVGNFQKLNNHVYRGAQPTEAGFQNLAKLGIRTIIDLQEAGTPRSADEARIVKSTGMQYISIPMRGMHTPSDKSVATALDVLENTSGGPVFVHCHRGADRTGGVIACYRIEHDHWTNGQALSEARSMGMSWYQKAIQQYVRHFQPGLRTVASQQAVTPALATAMLTP